MKIETKGKQITCVSLYIRHIWCKVAFKTQKFNTSNIFDDRVAVINVRQKAGYKSSNNMKMRTAANHAAVMVVHSVHLSKAASLGRPDSSASSRSYCRTTYIQQSPRTAKSNGLDEG